MRIPLASFGLNTIIYAAGNIGLRVSSFLMIPLYTHFLSMSDFGLLATLLLTIQVLMTLMEFGSSTALIRFAGEYRENNKLGTLLGSSILTSLMACAVVSFFTILFSESIFRNILRTGPIRIYIALACGAAASQTLFIKILSYHRAKEEGVKFTTASLLAAAVLFAVNWYFLVIRHQGIIGVMISQIITYGGAWLILTGYIGATSGIRFSSKAIRKLAVFGFPLVFAMLGHIATDTSAVYFLSYFKSLEEVAIFSLGYKIASITGIVLILPFELAYEPFVYANKDRAGVQETISRLLTYLMLFFIFIALGVLYVFRPLFPFIAPPEYASAYMLIIWLFPGFAFLGFRGVGQSLLHIRNKTSVTGAMVTGVTLVSILLQYLLVPKIGMVALVLVFNIMNISIGIGLMAMGIREFPIPIETTRLITIGCLYVALMGVGYTLWTEPAILFYTLIPCAALCALMGLYLFGFFRETEKAAIRSRCLQATALFSNHLTVKN